MRDDIRQYARIGMVHQLLYPRMLEDPDDHARTLEAFVGRDDMETFDCCLPYGEERRKRLIPIVRECGKEDIAYASHLFPNQKLPITSSSLIEQAQARLIFKDMIEQAVAIGAAKFIFASGGPSMEEAGGAHYAAFADFCRWFCGELKLQGIAAVLEPFDFAIDKKYLYGPTTECVELIRGLKPEVDNLGISLDIAHIPLIGESFEHAIKTTASHLKRVHLGNCVLSDPSHSLYGDKHPPIGIDGGEIDLSELTEVLRLLFEVGYLQSGDRGSLVLEMAPWPGRTPEETAVDAMARLEKAWEAA